MLCIKDLKAQGKANGTPKVPNSPRLTVVVSANLLRARGAAISQGLSWDQTIMDTVREFEKGRSKQDLALCSRVVVRFGTAGAACFKDPGDGLGPVKLERFLYHPDEQEGDWERQRPGQIFGATSILTAAVVRHVLDPKSFPIFLALGRALRAAQITHEEGAGMQKEGTEGNPLFGPSDALVRVGKILHWKPKDQENDGQKDGNKKGQNGEPASIFFTAFPHEILSDSTLKLQAASESDLLRDVTGAGIEYIAASAADVVLRGPRKALKAAPKASYGDFLTVDRDEIERINAIRRLAETYLNNPEDRTPLSIAVFGPPGSGKSFAIKELAKCLFREKREPLKINLAQLGKKDVQLLKEAFHRVRDASVQGQVPLVFWDEFDADGLFWLKFFLAPMQDREFRSGSLVYPLGKAIFVFAGGTKPTFEEFIEPLYNEGKGGSEEEKKRVSEFRENKGPDFVSRLRGFMNVKGPNPTGDKDLAYLIRRAMLLRSILERDYAHLILKEEGTALVSPSVIQGFLRVEKYLHGTRSLESLIRASNLRPSWHYFEPSQLPPESLLRMYVTPDFLEKVQEGELETPVIEAIARKTHEEWQKRQNESQPEYDNLDEEGKEDNRFRARCVRAILGQRHYTVKPSGRDGDADGKTVSKLTEEPIMKIWHDMWLRKKLMEGFSFGETRDKALLLHENIAPYDVVSKRNDEKWQGMQSLVQIIPDVLHKKGYRILPLDGPHVVTDLEGLTYSICTQISSSRPPTTSGA